jgi:hypothetical protein
MLKLFVNLVSNPLNRPDCKPVFFLSFLKINTYTTIVQGATHIGLIYAYGSLIGVV